MQRVAIGSDLRSVQERWPVGMPTVRSLKEGLFELRSTSADGEWRLFFIASAGEIVVLHGYMKKSSKTPDAELETARKRQKETEKKS